MIDFLEKIAPWVFTTLVTLAAAMAWGRISDRQRRDEEEIAELKALVRTLEKQSREVIDNFVVRFERVHEEIAAMRVDHINTLNVLKEALDSKYMTKEMHEALCAKPEK